MQAYKAIAASEPAHEEEPEEEEEEDDDDDGEKDDDEEGGDAGHTYHQRSSDTALETGGEWVSYNSPRMLMALKVTGTEVAELRPKLLSDFETAAKLERLKCWKEIAARRYASSMTQQDKLAEAVVAVRNHLLVEGDPGLLRGPKKASGPSASVKILEDETKRFLEAQEQQTKRAMQSAVERFEKAQRVKEEQVRSPRPRPDTVRITANRD
jgi:hypothetical protein